MPKIGETFRYQLYNEDCREVMKRLAPASVDSIVTDPPYGLKFMGKDWDHGVPSEEFWRLALRVIKPSGYMLAFGGTRTFHRLAVAIENAGWEIRDTVCWLYGTGFPKAKSCLKPAWEPILLCRKPGPKVLPLGIDDCRIGVSKRIPASPRNGRNSNSMAGFLGPDPMGSGFDPNLGRWPANVVHDGSNEVLNGFGEKESKSTGGRTIKRSGGGNVGSGKLSEKIVTTDDPGFGDNGSVARFFYCAKASRAERDEGLNKLDEVPCGLMEDDNYPIKTGSGNLRDTRGRNHHPTVKPLALLSWLIKLITTPGGIVFDPFMGSASTGVAALQEGRRFIGAENDTEHGYFGIAQERIRKCTK